MTAKIIKPVSTRYSYRKYGKQKKILSTITGIKGLSPRCWSRKCQPLYRYKKKTLIGR